MKNDPRNVYPGTQFYGAMQPTGMTDDPRQQQAAVGMNYGMMVPPGGLTQPHGMPISTGFAQPMSTPHTTLSTLFT